MNDKHIEVNLFDYISVSDALNRSHNRDAVAKLREIYDSSQKKEPAEKSKNRASKAQSAKTRRQKKANNSADSSEDYIAAFCQEVKDLMQTAQPDAIYHTNASGSTTAPILFSDRAKTPMVNGYAGVLKFTLRGNGEEPVPVVLNIHSRFDNMDNPNGRFLMHVFQKGALSRGQTYDDMCITGKQGAYWNVILAINFVKQLHDAMQSGLFRQYRDYERNDFRLRGRIDIARHIRENPIFTGKVSYISREYTVDNSINALILRTYHQLEKKYPYLLRRLVAKDDVVRHGLQILESEVENWTHGTDFEARLNTNKPIANSIYRKYEPLRQTCHAVLRNLGMDLYHHTGTDQDRISGILIDLPKLWEEFLYYAVIRDYAGLSGPYSQDKFHIINGPKIEPDYLIPVRPDPSGEGASVETVELRAHDMVLDAKYKPFWSKTLSQDSAIRKEGWKKARNDVFQVLAYTLALDCNSCGVIFPVAANANTDEEYLVAAKVYQSDYSIRPTPIQKQFCQNRYFAHIPYIIPQYTGDDNEYRRMLQESDDRLRTFLDQLHSAGQSRSDNGDSEKTDDFDTDLLNVVFTVENESDD